MTSRPRRLVPTPEQRANRILKQTRGAHSAQGAVPAARPVASTPRSKEYVRGVSNVLTGTGGADAVSITSTEAGSGNSDATGANSISIGNHSSTAADSATSVGDATECDAYRGATFGYGAFVSSPAQRGLAVGAESGTHGAWGTALGARTVADAAGSAAIGCDSSGTGAVSATINEIRLGTNSHITVIEGQLVIADGATFYRLDATGGTLTLVAYP